MILLDYKLKHAGSGKGPAVNFRTRKNCIMVLNILTNVTWLDYLLFLGASLTIYYLVVGIKFYSQDFKEILSGQRYPKINASPGKSGNHRGDPLQDTVDYSDDPSVAGGFEQTNDETFELVERLISTMKIVIQDSADKQMNKEEFTQRIAKILEFYSDLKQSQFQWAINELIISECEKIEFIPLSEDELMQLW